MLLARRIGLIFGKNLLGFVAISLCIMLISFLPSSFSLMSTGKDNPMVVSFHLDHYLHNLASYVTALLHGNLGNMSSTFKWTRTSTDIATIVITLASRSALILFPGVILGMIAGVLLGASTFFLPKPVRNVLNGLNQIVFSVPDLLLLVLFQLIALRIDIWYGGGPLIRLAEFPNKPAILLPIVCILAPVAAYVYRVTIQSFQDAFRLEFIKAASAKGLPKRMVVWKHVMRPAADSLLAVMPRAVAFSASSLLVVERLFNIYGLTYFFNGDKVGGVGLLNVLATLLICLALFIFLFNLGIAMLRLWVNPALRR